jgi:general secretion pathway protein K
MKAQQRGVAVVLAMGVIAVAAIAATAIMASQSTWLRQNELAAQHAQAQVLVQAGVDWSRAVLVDDLRTSSVDHPGEPWALKLAPVVVENGEIAGYIEDQQGLFNLNNLVQAGKVNPAELASFRRLLSILGLSVELASALVDWIDDDTAARPEGAEDDYYRALDPPYLAANRPLTDVGELALVRGFDDDARARLRPFVTALPRVTAVNVNTAAPEVLAAVVAGLGLDSARSLVSKRERIYFRSALEFAREVPGGIGASGANITVSSNFFMVHIRATIGQAQARGTALLARDDNYRWPAVIWKKYL